jgi:hypothetical protein
MQSRLWLNLASAALVITAGSSALFAQDFSEMAYKETSGKTASPPPQKVHKVWTDDDMGSVKTVADRYQDQKQALADQQVAANAAAQAKQEKTTTPDKKVGGPAALSNAKSAEDADRMIAWEQRDIDAQTEFVDKVRAELSEASTQEERERLQKKLAERQQILEQVKQEHTALVAQKKELLKKAAAGVNGDKPQGQ